MTARSSLASRPPSLARTPILSVGLLRDIAGGLAAAVELWQPHAHHGGERRPVRLVASATWEAWVIGWTAGQHVDWHDHGDSAAAVAVTQGALVDITLTPDGPRRSVHEAGTTFAVPLGAVHDIVPVGGAPATSIHVYSAPLSTMAFYDDEGRRTNVTAVDDEAPILDLRATARALHPSASRVVRCLTTTDTRMVDQ